MEKISHSIHRRQSSTSALSKSMLKLHSFSRSAVYDDMFAGHPMSGARNVSSRVEDYNEIFNSSRAFRSSSIPFIDLPPLSEKKAKDRTCAVDYSNIFGTLNESDIGLSSQQLFSAAKQDACILKNPWITEEPLLFADSDPFISLGKSEEMSCESVHQPYHSQKQFNMSYHKTIQENRNGVSGTTHIAHLHAVPGFTFIIDDAMVLQRTNSKKEAHVEAPLNNEEADREDQNEVASHSSFSDRVSEEDGELQEGHPYEVPFDVTPLSKTSTDLGGDENSYEHLRSSNFEACRQDPVSCSAPCSDDEVDANSEAAASAAALRRAIKEAQVKIRFVKELMRKKNEGSESSMRTKFMDPIKSRVTGCQATEGDEVLCKNMASISAENECNERKYVESIDHVMQILQSDMISVDGSKFEQLMDKNGNRKLAFEVYKDMKIEGKNDTIQILLPKAFEAYKDVKIEGKNDTIQILPPIIELNKEKKAEENQCAVNKFHTEPVPELHEEKVLEEREDSFRTKYEQEEPNLPEEANSELITTTSHMKEPEPVQPYKMEQFSLPIELSGIPGLLEVMNTNVNATAPMVATVPDKVKNCEEFVERAKLMAELKCGDSEKEQETMFEQLGMGCENSDDAILFEKEEPGNSFHDCEDNLGTSQFDESPTIAHEDSGNMDGMSDLYSDDINSEPFEMVNASEVTLENPVLGEVTDEGNYNLLMENPTLEEMDATLSKEGESENCFSDYEDNLVISELDETSTTPHGNRIIDETSNLSSDDTDSEQLEVIKSPEVTPENTTLEEVTEEAGLNLPTENSVLEEMDAEEALRKEHHSVCEIRRNIDEESIRRRQAAKDREAVRRAIHEARERAFLEARERAAMQRATAEVQKRTVTDAQANAKTKLATALDAKIRAERAAVERATAEARQRALQKAISGKFASQTRESGGAKQNVSSFDHDFQPCDPSTSSTHYFSFNHKGSRGANGESELRVRARLERHQRTAERAAKALAEKDMRDLVAQREQAERNRIAETLDADVRRWSSGKHGNLRALLSTLQYILGTDSSWQPIPLTDIVTSHAVRKAYRKATLCVHPDKLQQRGAGIQQKYVCEKVFDLLKDAWNKFNSEES